MRSHMILLGALCLATVSGCGVDQRAASQWHAEFLPPLEPPAGTLTDLRTADSPADPGYFLLICVDAVGVEYGSWERFSATFQSPPGRGKWNPAAGHAWIALQTPTELTYLGHTGNEGHHMPTISRIFMEMVDAGHPNPAMALHQVRLDGRSHGRPGKHLPSYVLKVPITQAQNVKINQFASLFDYRRFDLCTHQCTDFVVQAAWRAGLRPASRVRIDMPDQARLWGKNIRFWTDPKYRTIALGSPDVLVASLREYEAQGIGTDATQMVLDDLQSK
jgi:hypothetical protein